MAATDNPFVVKLFFAFESETKLYFVMEVSIFSILFFLERKLYNAFIYKNNLFLSRNRVEYKYRILIYL